MINQEFSKKKKARDGCDRRALLFVGNSPASRFRNLPRLLFGRRRQPATNKNPRSAYSTKRGRRVTVRRTSGPRHRDHRAANGRVPRPACSDLAVRGKSGMCRGRRLFRSALRPGSYRRTDGAAREALRTPACGIPSAKEKKEREGGNRMAIHWEGEAPRKPKTV